MYHDEFAFDSEKLVRKWLGPFCRFKGERGTTMTPAPRVSESQQALIDAISKWLQPQIGKGAEPYPGALYPDIPDLFTQAYESFAAGEYADISKATIEQLISGVPGYTFDPGKTTERWRETYAGPVMEAYEEFVLPGIKEGFNIPGVLYSRGRGEGVARAKGGFYGQYVAPSLFSALQTGERMGFESGEAAQARRAGALGLPYQQAMQRMGVAGQMYGLQAQQMGMDYREWLRTRAEPGWAIQTAMGFMTDYTMDWAAQAQLSDWDKAMQAGALAIGAWDVSKGG